jgi:hypothetical protein
MVLAKTQKTPGIYKKQSEPERAMSDFEERLRAMSLGELGNAVLTLLLPTGAGERDDNCVDIAIRLGPGLTKEQFDHAMSHSTGAPTQPTPLQYARYILAARTAAKGRVAIRADQEPPRRELVHIPRAAPAFEPPRGPPAPHSITSTCATGWS